MEAESTWLEERPSVEVDVGAGTYAERLARAGCSAEHALWALRHGCDWRAGWAGCPRPDWLAEAWTLAECREGGGSNHRRLVLWIAQQVERDWSALLLRCDPASRPRVERATMAVRAATGFAIDWSAARAGGPPDFRALFLVPLFRPEEVDWTPAAAREAGRSADQEALALVRAALFSATSALSGDRPGRALRALAWHHAWSDEHPGLSRAFAEAFPCPESLRCEAAS